MIIIPKKIKPIIMVFSELALAKLSTKENPSKKKKLSVNTIENREVTIPKRWFVFL